jgi:hypothetical protein
MQNYHSIIVHNVFFCAQVSGECATVTDTWAQVTLPIPLGFTPPTDGVSNPAVATGNPPSLQARVCAPTNFAYVMSIPASQPSQKACGEWAVSSIWRLCVCVWLLEKYVQHACFTETCVCFVCATLVDWERLAVSLHCAVPHVLLCEHLKFSVNDYVSAAACCDAQFTAGAGLTPIGSTQQSVGSGSATRSARATITGCDAAALPAPGGYCIRAAQGCSLGAALLPGRDTRCTVVITGCMGSQGIRQSCCSCVQGCLVDC